MDRTNSPINSILEQAAHIVRRKKETTGTLEPTESYKRGQRKKLIDFANYNNLWISLSNLNVEFLSKGGENEVYTRNKDNIVIKLNNFEYAGDDLENFFIRINAHNKLFGNIPYQMIGFAYNSKKEFCAEYEVFDVVHNGFMALTVIYTLSTLKSEYSLNPDMDFSYKLKKRQLFCYNARPMNAQ